MPDVPWADFRRVVKDALEEDLPNGDPTGAAVGARPSAARLVARRAGTVAGLVSADLVLSETSRMLARGAASAEALVGDGAVVVAGQVLMELRGPADTLLAAERTLLNLVCHLSGVASATAAVAAELEGTGTVLRDTRKTIPGLRGLQKYAVRCGGGANHRMSLSDAVLVKDNHVAALGSIAAAVDAVRSQAGGLEVEVEVDDLAELDEALAAGVDLVLVDNMDLAGTAEAVRRARRAGARVEASGGITIANARAVASTGVDFIAMGALTHSAVALDVGLDWEIAALS
ncbi:MAG TPA: carboxylating nicotinate-nucleotide diphosphorylase [Acidimicrobiales bacterium]|nr:carboxylating nicotinate-nucleotide diphosphorylase [Acidimicrobiales bacterium]